MMSTLKTKLSISVVRTSTTNKELIPKPEGQPRSKEKWQRPTKRAQRLANALWLEGNLIKGVYGSLRDARHALGLSKGITDQMFKLLQLPPEEMERILDETY